MALLTPEPFLLPAFKKTIGLELLDGIYDSEIVGFIYPPVSFTHSEAQKVPMDSAI